MHQTFSLKKRLYVSGYRTTLISVSSVIDNGHKVVRQKKNNFLRLKSKEKIPQTKKAKLFLRTTPKQEVHCANLTEGSNELWHKRKGHLNYKDFIRKNSLPRDLKVSDEKCESSLSKTSKSPVPKQSENEASKARESVFTNVVGPITASNVDGFGYFVTFIDKHRLNACVKFTQYKNQAFERFKQYIAENGTPGILRPDSGTQYTNKSFKHFSLLYEYQNKAKIDCFRNRGTEWCRRTRQPTSC